MTASRNSKMTKSEKQLAQSVRRIVAAKGVAEASMPQKLTRDQKELFRAIERKDARAVQSLLARGVDPNTAESSDHAGNETVLMAAAGCLFPEGVEIILKAGADPNACTTAGEESEGGETALHFAVTGSGKDDESNYRQRIEVVDLLLKAGADPNVVNGGGETPLYWAANGGYLEAAKRLLEGGAEADPSGREPPLSAAANRKYATADLAQLLLEHGAPADAGMQTPDRTTALITAAYRGAEEVLELLIRRGANVNHRAKSGRTPLIAAAQFARYAFVEREHQMALRMIKQLIEAGADPNDRDNDGKTALDWASGARSGLVANFLRRVSNQRKR